MLTSWDSDDIASASFRSHMLDSGCYKSTSVPLWKELEDAARLAQSDKRNETRKAKKARGEKRAEENMSNNAIVPDSEDDLMEEQRRLP
jgi:hypothetical protein